MMPIQKHFLHPCFVPLITFNVIIFSSHGIGSCARKVLPVDCFVENKSCLWFGDEKCWHMFVKAAGQVSGRYFINSLVCVQWYTGPSNLL